MSTSIFPDQTRTILRLCSPSAQLVGPRSHRRQRSAPRCAASRRNLTAAPLSRICPSNGSDLVAGVLAKVIEKNTVSPDTKIRTSTLISLLMRSVPAALLLTMASLAAAQTWDSTGNALLKGAWCFRQVVWQVGDSSGNLSREISLSGNINFDGTGKYTLTNLHTADTASPPVSASTNGTFSIAASGYGSLSSPLFSGDQVNGLVAQGIFVGSSTENHTGYHDLFIAAQLGTPVFQGSYTLADLDFPTASIFDARDSLLQLNPDGTANASGYVTATGLAPLNQYFSGLAYSVTNGVGAVDFGGSLSPANLVAGPKALYFSPDG